MQDTGGTDIKGLDNVMPTKRKETNSGTLSRNSFRAYEARGDPESSF